MLKVIKNCVKWIKGVFLSLKVTKKGQKVKILFQILAAEILAYKHSYIADKMRAGDFRFMEFDDLWKIETITLSKPPFNTKYTDAYYNDDTKKYEWYNHSNFEKYDLNKEIYYGVNMHELFTTLINVLILEVYKKITGNEKIKVEATKAGLVTILEETDQVELIKGYYNFLITSLINSKLKFTTGETLGEVLKAQDFQVNYI